jgi:hypothetical protein
MCERRESVCVCVCVDNVPENEDRDWSLPEASYHSVGELVLLINSKLGQRCSKLGPAV